MKYDSYFVGVVVGKPAERLGQDGKTKYYDLGVVVSESGEAGTLPCTEAVYNGVNIMQSYCLKAQYNSDYKSYRIIGAKFADEGNPSSVAASAAKIAATAKTSTVAK